MANEAEPGTELTPEQRIEEKLFGPIGGEEVATDETLADETLEAAETEEFIDDETEADPELEADAEDEPVAADLKDVEIDGQVYEVPPALYDAIMRTDDYTQKTQSLAEERKSLEVVRDSVTQARQQQEFVAENEADVRRGEEIDWQVKQLRQYMRENIDTLTGNDIEKVRFQIEEMSLEKDGIVQGLRAKYSEFQQATQQARQELRDKSTEALKASLPNWNEATEVQARDYGKTLGFTDDELDAAVDPREMRVLWEASEYRRLKAGAKPAARKASAAPKIRPKGRDARPADVRRKISIRKRLNNATGDKAKAKIIQEDIANRLNL